MAPLTEVEKKWLKRLGKQHPKLGSIQLNRIARDFARRYGDPDGYPSNGEKERVAEVDQAKEIVLDSMSLPEKAAIGAGLWGLKRWWRREVMPELVSQPSLAPTRKVAGAFEGGAVATIIIAAAGYFGVEIPPGVAAAIVTLVAFGYAWLRREKAPKEG